MAASDFFGLPRGFGAGVLGAASAGVDAGAASDAVTAVESAASLTASTGAMDFFGRPRGVAGVAVADGATVGAESTSASVEADGGAASDVVDSVGAGVSAAVSVVASDFFGRPRGLPVVVVVAAVGSLSLATLSASDACDASAGAATTFLGRPGLRFGVSMLLSCVEVSFGASACDEAVATLSCV